MSKQREKIFSKTDCLPLEVMLRYTQDKSSMKERNFVERHMLDCELCRDAVEGYELMADKNKASSIISDLNKKLEVKSDDNFVIRRIAAGVGAFIILGGGLFYLNQSLNNKEQGAIFANTQTDSLGSNLRKNEDVIAMDKKVEVPGAERNVMIESSKNENYGEVIKEGDISVYPESAPIATKQFLPPVIMEDAQAKEEKAIELYNEVEAPAEEFNGAAPVSSQVMEEEISLKDDARREKSMEKSKKAYSRAAGASADIAELNMLDQAIRKYNDKNYVEASALLEQYLKTDPDNAQALYYNGLSYFDAGNWDKAVDNFDQVKKATPYYEEARWKQAMALINKGEKKAAKEILTEISQGESKYKQQAVEELKKL